MLLAELRKNIESRIIDYKNSIRELRWIIFNQVNDYPTLVNYIDELEHQVKMKTKLEIIIEGKE